jgi:hypothetical protein
VLNKRATRNRENREPTWKKRPRRVTPRCSLPARSFQQTGRNKLLLLQALFAKGWRPQPESEHDPLRWYRSGHDLHLPSVILTRPESYLLALLLAPVIFEKPGGLKRIHHAGPHLYYRRLIDAADLTDVQRMSEAEVLRFGQQDTAQVPARRARSKRAPVHLALAVASADADPDSDGQEGAVVAAAAPLPSGATAAAALVEPALVSLADMPRVSDTLSRVPGQSGVRVLYDNYSHASGRLRAYLRCDHPGHAPVPGSEDKEKCRLYTFVDDHSSQAMACGFLFAWYEARHKFASGAEHRRFRPASHVVEAMAFRQAHSV